MKYEKKPLECLGETYEPPRTIEETLAIVAKARNRLGKTLSRRTTAMKLVLDNLPIIEDWRDRGHRQEDAVLLILELSNDAHKPDTIRKAIRAAVGDWVVAPPPRASPSITGEIATSPSVASAGHEPAPGNEDEGVTVL